MKLIYPGPFDQVEVPAAGIVAVRDVPVDVPEPHTANLLDQGWQKPRPKKEQ